MAVKFVKLTVNRRINLKALVPKEAQVTAKVTKLAKNLLGAQIAQGLKETNFSTRAKESLSRSIKIETKPKSIVVRSTHPGIRQFLKGRRRRQMRWLKGTQSIPIVTREGKMIFRNATAKSMRSAGGGPNQGKPGWVHPGRPGDDFVSRAKARARKELKQQFKAMLVKRGRR